MLEKLQNTSKEIDLAIAELLQKKEYIAELEQQIISTEKNIKSAASTISGKLPNVVEQENFIKFFKKPYYIQKAGHNKCFVIVPKFIKNFQVGWLVDESDTFFIYQLDQYSSWLGYVPEDLLKEVEVEPGFKAEIVDDHIYYDPKDRDNIKSQLGNHLTDFTKNTARIVRGHEFDIILDMIKKGNLPFKPKAVQPEHIREARLVKNPLTGKPFQLYNYQKEADKEFFNWGAIGLFHPTGSGKSIVTSSIMDRLTGKKIIFAITKVILEQWEYYIDTYIPHCKNEITLSTYQGFRDRGDKYRLVVFDECQYLPANTFSRLSVLNTDYRIGLSAGPYREDGREHYIIALTGKPIGINWQGYLAERKKELHPINVHIVRNESNKIKKTTELLNRNKKTIIFCDGINLGAKLSSLLDVPHVHGGTKDNYKSIIENDITVCSRVADLGISVKNLEHIIETDFLFGSRGQQLQRYGRLLHSESGNCKHDIIFTEEEFDRYGKRLWSLQDKGVIIKLKK